MSGIFRLRGLVGVTVEAAPQLRELVIPARQVVAPVRQVVAPVRQVVAPVHQVVAPVRQVATHGSPFVTQARSFPAHQFLGQIRSIFTQSTPTVVDQAGPVTRQIRTIRTKAVPHLRRVKRRVRRHAHLRSKTPATHKSKIAKELKDLAKEVKDLKTSLLAKPSVVKNPLNDLPIVKTFKYLQEVMQHLSASHPIGSKVLGMTIGLLAIMEAMELLEKIGSTSGKLQQIYAAMDQLTDEIFMLFDHIPSETKENELFQFYMAQVKVIHRALEDCSPNGLQSEQLHTLRKQIESQIDANLPSGLKKSDFFKNPALLITYFPEIDTVELQTQYHTLLAAYFQSQLLYVITERGENDASYTLHRMTQNPEHFALQTGIPRSIKNPSMRTLKDATTLIKESKAHLQAITQLVSVLEIINDTENSLTENFGVIDGMIKELERITQTGSSEDDDATVLSRIEPLYELLAVETAKNESRLLEYADILIMRARKGFDIKKTNEEPFKDVLAHTQGLVIYNEIQQSRQKQLELTKRANACLTPPPAAEETPAQKPEPSSWRPKFWPFS